jgi:hypothetical protein
MFISSLSTEFRRFLLIRKIIIIISSSSSSSSSSSGGGGGGGGGDKMQLRIIQLFIKPRLSAFKNLDKKGLFLARFFFSKRTFY